MSDLTHIDDQGRARMVDVSHKDATRRVARAQAVLSMHPETVQRVRDNTLAKGDALAVARVAGILAAKRVDELIPLCHTLPLSDVSVDFDFAEASVTLAALTLYDMAKAIDKSLEISSVHLLSKTGGKSGDFVWQR